jgi:transcriptional regulator with XRE-family HTH domain
VETIDVGKRIKSIRKRKHLTLQEVSEKSGMSATAISAIERNVSSPTVNTLAAIGRALGESLSSLLGDLQGLAAGVPGQRFHPKLLILKPGGNSGEDFVNHPGDDFFFVIRGALEMEIGGTPVRLEEGDTLYVRGNTAFRWRNPSDREGTELLVVSAS